MWSTITATDVDAAKRLADQHKPQVGFVLRPALMAAVTRGELLYALHDGEVRGFCHWHRRRDGWTTIYEIVSTRAGGGRAMIAALPRPIRLKCPVDLPSNGFYAAMGMTLDATVAGRKRPLNVWTLRD